MLGNFSPWFTLSCPGEYCWKMISAKFFSSLKMYGTDSCLVRIELQCFVSKGNFVVLSRRFRLRNSLVMKIWLVSKIVGTFRHAAVKMMRHFAL